MADNRETEAAKTIGAMATDIFKLANKKYPDIDRTGLLLACAVVVGAIANNTDDPERWFAHANQTARNSHYTAVH